MSQSLLPNSVISHYRIVSKLGAGGMGEVWLAEDTRLGRKVALKLLPAEFTEDSGRVRRFTQEAKAASALNHPNIISVYDIGESETGRFIVMELVSGCTLRTVIATDNSLETFFTLSRQMAKALSAAHAAGITHRDIKPDNIMVRDDGYVKMLDFGLARLLPTTSSDPEAATLAQQTTPGTVMGTLAYMSPEQASGQTVGSASDVFALGIVLYELATGQHPFKSETMIGYLHAITSQTPPSMTSLKSQLPIALDELILRMLEKDVRQRPTADEVAQALQEIEKYGSSSTLPFRVVADKPKATRKEEGFRVAVLPFKVRDTDPDIGVLAEGLSEEISTGLSRFRYLSVVTSASAVRLSGETESERSVNAKLGTRYVLEGSIRKGGSIVRVTAQLIDSETGAQLWSENYNRDLQMSTIFDVQDDVAGRIVATVADSYGVLVHSMRAATRKKDDVDLTPVEWQFQYFAYREQITPTAYAELKSRLQRIAERNVGQSDVWACLSQIYVDEYAFGFGGDATSLDRALAAGRRAVELDRANQFALVALAQVHFFRQDLAAFGPAAERGMALNPLNTDALGILGLQIVHTGEFERGTGIVRRAMELNPNHAGWMHFAPLWNHFHKGEYEQALECANRVDVPGLFWPYLVMASACGHLGRRTEAEAAVRDLLVLDPEFAAHVRANVGTWHFASGLMNSILEGLRKAGLEIDKVSETPDKVGVDASTAFPSFEGRPAIAVLPFDNRSNDPEQEYFADGLAEDLITRLSLWRSFPVIARNSSFVYKGKAVDVKKVSADLGVRYVVEGSVRKAGNQVRIAAQLIDASTGQHVWAKTYDRELTDVFAVQDEISGAIAASLVGDLQRAEHQRSQRRAPENLEAWGLYQRALPLLYRFTREDSNQARALLERATALDPQFSTALARLAELGVWDFIFGWTDSPQQTLDRAVAQARRAVDLDPTDAEARSELAFALMTAGFGDEALEAALHGLDLNPCLPFALIVEGYLRNLSGNPPEESIELMKRAMRLSPHDPAEFLFYDVLSAAYMNAGRYAEGLAAGRRLVALLPSYYWGYLWSAMNAVGLGRHEEARAMIRDAREVHPGLSLALARQALGAMAPEVERRFTEALRQAGLEIGDEEPSTSSAPSLASSETRADEGFWVAVLPFKYLGADADLTALADALSEDIVTGLSRFSYLRVIARSSTSRYLHEAVDVRAAGRELGARYVMEGNLRQSRGKLRLAVQLVDAVSGAHLWAESYERTFSSETVFDLQDDLVPRIVSTVADTYGVLPRSMSEMLRKKSPDQLSPYEAVLRSFGYYERITPEEHAKVTEVLEWAVDNAPEQADCWAMLAMMYKDEHTHGFNVRPDPLGRALAAAHRAVEAAPSNHVAYHALATALFFRREIAAFRNAAERTVALNPMDGGTTAFVGHLMAYAGDWERGCALVEHARQLNPNHPGWYWFPTYFDSYRKRDYRGALEIALKINMPGYFYSSAVIAAAYGQLGEPEAARTALQELLAMKPGFATTARKELGKWFGPGELLEHFLDGLRKAGLEIADEEYASTASATSMVSRESRADEGFWVAVLPLKYVGSNQDLTALAEGMSEEVVTGLSRFSYLRVIAHGSTAKYSNKSGDIRAIGKELGARYVMEGSLRLAGSMLRVTVQLIDAGTGVNLWAETYDRPFNSEEMFALQDELVPRIVSTVADQYGALVHSMSESLRGRSAGQYSAHEAVLRSFGYWERMTPEEHAEVRDILEAAVAAAPDHSDCLAALAMIYWHEYAFSYNLRPDPVGRARTAAQRAVAYAPTSHFAHCALATSLFFQKDYQAFRPAAERALALNRMDASTMEILGQMIAYAGDWEYGLRLVERAMQLNPHHPGWYHYLALCDAYRRRDYHGALESALKVNMPAYHWPHVYLAAVYGQLGEHQRASEALRQLHALIPNFDAIAREEMRKWLDAELTEHLLEGLRKAGLTIADEDRPVDTSSALHASGEKRADEGFWVAVLPFKATGTNADLSTLAEGLSDEIVTGLNRFSYLRVIARSSTLRYASETSDVRTIGKTLGARYVMEGGVRQAGSVLRVTVQLIDAHTGAHLWAETYDRPFRSEDIFALQDDLVPRIVSTVADQHGVLPHTMSEALRFRDPDSLRPHEVVLRGFGYYERGIAAEHAALRSALERAVEEAPGSADCWAMLAIMYCDEHKFGFNALPDSLGRARASAQRAVEASASNPFAYEALAQALFFRREFNAFRNAAERAIALNPLDGATTAFMGMLMACTGDWEHGCAVAERATKLNPHHPGWYWGAAVWNAYRKGDYSDALGFALKFNMPGFFHHHLNLAATYGQLGEHEAASKALRDLLALKPDFAANARDELGKFFEPELVEHMIDGLRKAGLEIASEEEEAHHVSSEKRAGLHSTSDQSSSAITNSGLTSAFSSSGSFSRPAIVVLPFVNRSPDADNEYFSDGLTEEIISDLSVIKALRVISRNSSMSFKGTSKDTFSIGKELGVSHIVSGSVRKAGDDLRITVELVEVAGDTPLWSDKFSGTIANVFGFQEEISRKIVNALQVRLTEAEAQVIAERPIDNAAAYDCYMRARHEIYLFTAEGLDRAQKLVDSGLSLIGENSLLLATRGMVSWYYLNFSIRPEEKYLDEAAAYATKALEQDPQNCFGIFLRGLVAAKRGDIESALRDIRTAHEQKPGDSMILNELIRHLLSAGLELTESARPAFEESLRLDPLRPLNWAQAAWRRFCAGQIDDSVAATQRILDLTDLGNPARVYAAYYLAIANVREEAINVFDEEGAVLAGTAYGSLSLFLSRALRGDAEGAVKNVTPQLEQAATWTEYLALLLADGYSFLGHNDAAMKWLHAAVAQGFINYPYLAKRDPLLVNVRSDPRFAELMRKVKPRWEALTPSDELQFVECSDEGPPEVKDDKLKFVGHSVGHSIAVLPFVNISNEQENEYFCDGLAEELLNALSKIESLHVAARTSAFSFKGKDADIREIASRLNVSTVLEGSVRKSGNRVRISVQLVNVEDGYHLWSEKYDRELKDIFDIQDEISLAIVDTLKLKLLGAEQKVVKRYTDNTEAYQLYLKGRFFVNQRTSQSLLKAIDYFNQAIALDANYALGYAGLADAYMVLGVPDAVTEAFSPRDSLIKARDAAEKALKIDTSVGEVYAALAHIKWKERDWTGAEHDYLRSIELNPHNPIAHFYYAVCLAGLGRCDEAVKEITRAQELDPLSLPVNASVVYVLYLCRRYDEAIEAGKKTLDLDSAFPLTHQRLGLPYIQKKMYREAIAEFEQAVKTSNRAPQPLVSLGHAFAVSGNKVEALKVLAELKELSQSRYVSPYGVAAIYVGLNDKEQAFDWLAKAFAEDNTELTFLKVDPRMDPLRNDSRFQELLDRVGFPD